MLASVSGSITSFVGNHGVYAVFLLMLIDAVFPAFSELVMLYAGALAAGFAGYHVVLFGTTVHPGFRAYLVMALSGTIGYLAGAIIGWWIGLKGGRPLVERHGRWFHLDEERMSRAERWFDRWEDWAVLLGRLTPLVRSFVSIPAGVFRHPFARYTVLSAIGSAIWAFAFAGAGWALGRRWTHLHHGFRYVDYAVAALILLAAAWLVWRWRSSRLARRAADSAR